MDDSSSNSSSQASASSATPSSAAPSPERKFLHDIASHMAVIKLVLARIQKDTANPTLDLKAITQLNGRLDRALQAMEALERLHAERKEFLTKSASQSNAA